MNPPDATATPINRATPASAWVVYIIRASDDRLYTGITTDIERRWSQHRDGRGGAKFFRGRSPEALVLVEAGHDRVSASKREAAIKRLSRSEKLELIARAGMSASVLAPVNAVEKSPKKTASPRLAVKLET